MPNLGGNSLSQSVVIGKSTWELFVSVCCQRLCQNLQSILHTSAKISGSTASISNIHDQAFRAVGDWAGSFIQEGVKQSIVIISHNKPCLAEGKERECYMTHEKQRKLRGTIVEHPLRGNPREGPSPPGHISANLYHITIKVPSSSIR